MCTVDLSKVFFKSDTYDPSTKLPIYVLDSTALPNPNQCNFVALIELLIGRIPSHNYVLIFFTAGLSNDPSFAITNHNSRSSAGKDSSVDSELFKFSWVWGVKTFSLIPADKRKFLRKIYIVHESWWIRALTEVLKSLISSKFLSPSQEKVIHISHLSELSRHVDITKINISLANYYYEFNKVCSAENSKKKSVLRKTKSSDSSDSNTQQYQEPPKIVIPIHLPEIFGVNISSSQSQLAWYYYNLVFFKIAQIYYTSNALSKDSANLILFHNNSPSLVFRSNILQDSISRNQVVDLDQFGIFTLVNLWKYFLKNLRGNSALIPLDVVIASAKSFQPDDISSVNRVVNEVVQANQSREILNDIMNFLVVPMALNDINHLCSSHLKNDNSNSNDSNDTASSYLSKLCKFFTKFFCGIIADYLEEERSLGTKLIRGLIEFWPYLDANANKVPFKSCSAPIPPISRKCSGERMSVNLSLAPNNSSARSSFVQLFTNYIQQTNLISTNMDFINSKSDLLSKLNDYTNLNNFNIFPDSDTEYQSQRQSNLINLDNLEVGSEGKENQLPESDNQNASFKALNNKIKSNFKTYFKPLTESSTNSINSGIASDDSLLKSFSSMTLTKQKPRVPKKRQSMTFNDDKILPLAPPRLPPRSPSVSSAGSPGSVGSNNTNNSNNNGCSERAFKKPPVPPASRMLAFDTSPRSLNNYSSQESLQSVSSGQLISKKVSNSSINNELSQYSITSSATANTTFSSPSVVTKKPSNASLTSLERPSAGSLAPAKTVSRVLKRFPQQDEFIYADKKKYAGVERGKVVKLAQLFEERLESIEILSHMEA